MLSHGLSVNEALSGIFGSVSLTAFICLLIPQLIVNYKAKSAEGLSMGFLAIWLFGDVTNLLGALVTGLAPTATALSGYFCISDVILISQCAYYFIHNARIAHRRRQSTATGRSEDEPLLRRSSTTLSGSRVRHSSHHDQSSTKALKRVLTGEDEMRTNNPWINNALGIIAIYVVGIAGWFISYHVGAWDKTDGGDVTDPDSPTGIGGMTLGYISAICYLCARIPQIIKNYREKSCDGLALLFFLFSLTGNLTYGLSVFSYSQSPDYLVKAAPWLIGSLGTIVEDCIIFYQFHIYTRRRDSETEPNDV